MRKLGMSEDEIAQVLADDKSIDRGERMEFDLSAEAEKQAKKYANVGTRKTTGEKTERKRKENPTKAAVIAEIANFLTENGYEMVEITNKERQIAFKIGENAYELTLVQKRKPKSWENRPFWAVFSCFWLKFVDFCAFWRTFEPVAHIRGDRNLASLYSFNNFNSNWLIIGKFN